MPFAVNLLLTLVLGSAAPAHAELSNWRVMLWTDPLVVSIDAASITELSTRITARVMWDYTDTQKTQDPSQIPFRSMIGLMVFDCTAERFGAAAGISYSEGSGAGQVVSRYAINPDQAKLTNPEPGTVAHELLDYVCAQARKGT